MVITELLLINLWGGFHVQMIIVADLNEDVKHPYRIAIVIHDETMSSTRNQDKPETFDQIQDFLRGARVPRGITPGKIFLRVDAANEIIGQQKSGKFGISWHSFTVGTGKYKFVLS